MSLIFPCFYAGAAISISVKAFYLTGMKGIKGINRSVIPEAMPAAWLSGIHFELMCKRQKLSLARSSRN
jgi:hypothetical protein